MEQVKYDLRYEDDESSDGDPYRKDEGQHETNGRSDGLELDMVRLDQLG